MEKLHLIFIVFIFILESMGRNLNPETQSSIGLKINENNGAGIKFREGEDDDEDEDEEEGTTVKGPGHEGILNGLSGIFSNVVKGNANGIIESTFNFVPPVYKNTLSSAYGAIVGKTTPKPTTTTAKATQAPPPPPPPSPPLNAQVSEVENTAAEEIDNEPVISNQGVNTQSEGVRGSAGGDDEEDEHQKENAPPIEIVQPQQQGNSIPKYQINRQKYKEIPVGSIPVGSIPVGSIPAGKTLTEVFLL